jgi:putative ABC transport system permease protein
MGLPGVHAVATATGLPPNIVGFSVGVVEGDGEASPDERETQVANLYVSSGYFRAMQIALIGGRDFAPDDDGNGVIISAALARHLWPSAAAVGRRFRLWTTAPWQTVIGVVDDVEHRIGTERLPWSVYFPLNGAPGQTRATMPPRRGVTRTFVARHLIVRGDDPMALVPAIRDQIRALDARIPIDQIDDVEQLWADVRAPQRFALLLVACLAAIAVILAAVGLVAMISHDVTQRTHEIGIRMALGASRASVLRLVLGGTTAMTAAGILLGLAGAAALTRYLEAILFGVTPMDPRMFALAVVVFAAVAAVASYLPSRRATRLHPQSALRWE